MDGRGAAARLLVAVVAMAALCSAKEFTADGMEVVRHVIISDEDLPPVRSSGRRLLGAPDPARTLSAPVNCNDWPQQRVYMEVQSWFTRVGDDIDTQSSHLHIGACLPHRQTVVGDVTLHLLIQKHLLPNNSTWSTGVSMSVVFTNQITRRKVTKFTVLGAAAMRAAKWVCSANATLCKAVVPIVLPTWSTKVFTPDGPQKMTLVASIFGMNDGKSTGRFMTATLDSWVVVNNTGRQQPILANQSIPIENLCDTQFPWGYTHAHFTSNFPIDPVSGNWTFNFKNFVAGAAAQSSNVTAVFASIDPNFHNTQIPDFTGKIILVDTDALQNRDRCPRRSSGNIDMCFFYQQPLDTTLLTDGTHKLFIRTDSFVSNASSLLVNSPMNGGTFSSILMLAFQVCNYPPCPNVTLSDDVQPLRDPLPPMNPPPDAAWYNGTIDPPRPALTLANPYNCSFWLGRRFYLEAQTWYTLPGAPITNSTQLHIGACLPHKQMIAGKFPFHLVLSKVNFPSYANATVGIMVTFFWTNGNVSFELQHTDSQGGWVCQDQAPLCRSVYVAGINTRPAGDRWMIPDGLNRLEIQATVSFFDGIARRELTARVESYTIVANTGPTTLDKPLPPSASARTGLPWFMMGTGLLTQLPLDPVSGPLGLQAAFTGASNGIGANVTGVFAAVDPLPLLRPVPSDGFVLVSASTPAGANASLPLALPFSTTSPAATCGRRGGDKGSATCSAALDPAAVPRSCLNPCDGGLCDGLHRLFLRTDSFIDPANSMFNDLLPGARVNAGTMSSVLVVPIVTSNGVAPSSPCTAKALATGGSPLSPAGVGEFGVAGGRAAALPTFGGASGGALVLADSWSAPGVRGAAVDVASLALATAAPGGGAAVAAAVIEATAVPTATPPSSPDEDAARRAAFS